MRSLDREAAESAARESSSFADAYARALGLGEPITDPAIVIALRRRFLSTLSRADLGTAAREWSSSESRFVMAVDRNAPGASSVTEARLKAVAAASEARPVAPSRDRAAVSALMSTLPVPGTITGTSRVDPPGATVWTLSNGARVVLLPTSEKADEVQFFATAPGGKSLAADADIGVAAAASLAATAAGLGGLSTADVASVLRGHTAVATPSMADYATRLRGVGSRQDLETLFQVIHLRFGLSHADPALFESAKRATRTVLGTLAATPELQFAEAITRALSSDSPRAGATSLADLDSWKLDDAVNFYRARFADAGNFTFAFVGSFDIETARPLVERYLASLPALPAHETWKDVGLRMPEGVIERTIRAGIEPKARVAIVFNGPFSYSARDRATMTALQSVVQSRLFGSIRNQLGGTYSITASSQTTNVPAGAYRFAVQWECDPQRVDELVRRVFAELEVVKTSPVSPAGLSAWRESIERNQASASNAVRVAQLLDAYENGGSAEDPWRVIEAIRTVTTADIMNAARTWLDIARYVKVVMLPVESPAAGQ
jgi:zinc protease